MPPGVAGSANAILQLSRTRNGHAVASGLSLPCTSGTFTVSAEGVVVAAAEGSEAVSYQQPPNQRGDALDGLRCGGKRGRGVWGFTGQRANPRQAVVVACNALGPVGTGAGPSP